MSRQYKRFLLGITVGAGLVALSRAWPMVADVKTGETPAYPDLQPRWYPLDRERVFAAALQVARRMPLWRVIDENARLGVFRAHATVLPIPFTDEVTVWVQPDGDETVVNVRSRSLVRGARSDLGVNARRIRAFLRALDRALQVP